MVSSHRKAADECPDAMNESNIAACVEAVISRLHWDGKLSRTAWRRARSPVRPDAASDVKSLSTSFSFGEREGPLTGGLNDSCCCCGR
jgi:hypothetical protein